MDARKKTQLPVSVFRLASGPMAARPKFDLPRSRQRPRGLGCSAPLYFTLVRRRWMTTPRINTNRTPATTRMIVVSIDFFLSSCTLVCLRLFFRAGAIAQGRLPAGFFAAACLAAGLLPSAGRQRRASAGPAYLARVRRRCTRRPSTMMKSIPARSRTIIVGSIDILPPQSPASVRATV